MNGFDLLNDPRHYEERAEEMRTIADGMQQLDCKAAMYRCAKDYNKLAERARQRSIGSRLI